MIKFCRDYIGDSGFAEFVANEIAVLDAESEDLMVRRNYADWHVMPEDIAAVVADAAPADEGNAAVEGGEA